MTTSHFRIIAVAIFALFLFYPLAAQAEKAELSYFSLELPAGWTAHEEGDLVILSTSDGETPLSIFLIAVEELDLEAQVEETAEGNTTSKLGVGYVCEDDTKARYWMFGANSAFIGFRSPETTPEVAAIIASLKSSEQAPLGTDEVFKAANDPQVIDWLMFK